MDDATRNGGRDVCHRHEKLTLPSCTWAEERRCNAFEGQNRAVVIRQFVCRLNRPVDAVFIEAHVGEKNKIITA